MLPDLDYPHAIDQSHILYHPAPMYQGIGLGV
jgi:hypothetical protein